MLRLTLQHPTRVPAVTAVAVLVLVLAAAEGLLAVILAHPERLPASGFLASGMRSIYLREDWTVPQADLDVVAYDPELTYLLRPGPTRFANREFDTTLEGNSAGLRDDEASLERPDVIVLGDSFAFGWGVRRQQTFAEVLERRTGLRVLNAAMSSYGTAREVILLERLDVSAARAVIVQYFMNDYRENRAFIDGGFTLTITPEDDFSESVRRFERQTRYWPLDYLKAFLDRRSFFPELENVSPREVAEACLRVLASSDELEDLPIFFLQIDPWGGFAHYDIVGPVAGLLETEPRYSGLRRRLTPVPLAGVLETGDFFRLDPHLRPSGHEKVAAELELALARWAVLRIPLESLEGDSHRSSATRSVASDSGRKRSS